MRICAAGVRSGSLAISYLSSLDAPAGPNRNQRVPARNTCSSTRHLFRCHWEAVCLGIADCAGVACSCCRRCKGTTPRSSLGVEGEKGGTMWSASEGGSCWSIPDLRTKTACGETVEQAMAPIAFPIGSNWTIKGVLVTACGHRDGALRRMGRTHDNVVGFPIR